MAGNHGPPKHSIGPLRHPTRRSRKAQQMRPNRFLRVRTFGSHCLLPHGQRVSGIQCRTGRLMRCPGQVRRRPGHFRSRQRDPPVLH